MNKLKLASNVTERIIMAISLKNNYSAKILKEIDVTYSHGTKIFNLLEKNKLITKKKMGSKIYINLTEKGFIIKEHLNEIVRLL